MYRVLKANKAVRERRDHLRHPDYKEPELLATAPNQVWSWDITKLLGPTKWRISTSTSCSTSSAAVEVFDGTFDGATLGVAAWGLRARSRHGHR